MKNIWSLLVVAVALLSFGCSVEDVGQAEKGRAFNRTGVLAFYANSTGFVGPVVGPGTYYTGLYGGVRTVYCGQVTHKENLGALTKDGVQFQLDVYVRTEANCSNDESVTKILTTLSPSPYDPKQTLAQDGQADGRMVTNQQLYETLVRPPLGESVRVVVSAYVANDVNNSREKIFQDVKKHFIAAMSRQQPELVRISEVTMNNMDFPDTLEKANVARAEQAILRDTAIAEREKVKAETETARAKQDLERTRAQNEAVRISEIGKSLRENPEYLQYQTLQLLPSIYEKAGVQGNLVITAPAPSVLVSPRVQQAAK